MGINWGSAIAKGVSVAGAHYQADRDKKAAEKRAFDQQKDLLGIQHTNAMSIQGLKNQATLGAARVKAGQAEAARTKITIPSFTVAGEIVPEAIFTYGGENVSQSEFKQGLINAYSNAAKHFKIIKDNSKLSPDQLQEIWDTNYAPALSTATANLYGEYALSNESQELMPPQITSVLGPVVGQMTEVRKEWQKLYDLSFSQEDQLANENWGKMNAALTGSATDHGLSRTYHASMDKRVGAKDPLSKSIIQNQTYLSASRAFENAVGEFSTADIGEVTDNYISAVRTSILQSNSGMTQAIVDALPRERVLQIASDASNAGQAAFIRDGRKSVLNRNFVEVRPSANQEQLYNSAVNLSSKIVTVVKGLKRPEVQAPLTSPAATGFLTGISNIVVGLGEAIPFIGGYLKDDGVLKTGEELLKENSQGRADKDIASQLLSDISEGRNFTGDDKEQFTAIKAQLEAAQKEVDEAFKDINLEGAAGEKAMATYNFHMDKLYLAYAYSKYLQGGAGGNAVSNADFQNTMNALFGSFGANPAQNRAILASGMMKMHHGVQKDIRKLKQQERYTYNFDGKSMDTTTSLSTAIRESQYRARTSIVEDPPQPGESYFDSVNRYWSEYGVGTYNPQDRSTNAFGGAGAPKQIIVQGEE
tara:strand:- start:1619 stop:3556 length:1938 start_codon:yes stop_codon:yes gene_type:complete